MQKPAGIRDSCGHSEVANTPRGSRTPVSGLRILHPGPLDDGGGSTFLTLAPATVNKRSVFKSIEYACRPLSFFRVVRPFQRNGCHSTLAVTQMKWTYRDFATYRRDRNCTSQ